MLKLKLSKIMEMTTSTNDAEALVAIRKANALMKAEGLTWENVLLPKKEGTPPVKREYKQPDIQKAPNPQPTSKNKYSGEEVEFMLDER